MSTSTLSRPPARRATVLVVVGPASAGPAPEVPNRTAHWAVRAGWTVQRQVDGGPAEAAAAARPGARTLLLRPGVPDTRRTGRRPHVVAALDTLPDDDAVVADAVACAAAVDGALTFVHAVPRSFAERSVDLDGAVAHGLRLLDAAVAESVALRPALVPATQLLRVRPHELVGEALDADLLVVGGARSGGPGSVQPGGLGLVAHSALHHAPCPVLVTPR